MINSAVVQAVAPLCKEPGTWAGLLETTAAKYEINTPRRVAAWLAQLAHESAQFNRVAENLNYSAEGLMRVWPLRFPSLAHASEFNRNPEKIANRVYSGRMGNGDESSGDGWAYRGRGLIQLTGRSNYRRAGQAMGMPFEQHPEIVQEKPNAAATAGWYWQSNGLNERADMNDFEGITRVINGGRTGLEDRLEFLKRAQRALGVV